MPKADLPTDVKSLREALEISQAYLMSAAWYDINVRVKYSELLQGVIDECDKLRPLGADGQHGELHTETCGCEDKGHGSWCKHICCSYSYISIYGGVCKYCGHIYPTRQHVTGGLYT